MLGNGEIGIDTTNRIRKTGDGVKTWTQLSSEWIGVDMCRLVRSSAQSMPNSDTAVSWNSIVRDVSSTGQTQGSANGITIQKAGVYGYRVLAVGPEHHWQPRPQGHHQRHRGASQLVRGQQLG